MKNTVLLIFCAIIFTSYSQVDLFAQSPTQATFEGTDDLTKLKNKAKNLFEQRNDTEKLNETIQLMEEIVQKDKDPEIMATLTRAYYFLGEYTQGKKEKMAVYDKGIKAGENALNNIGAFTKAMEETKKEEEAIKVLTIDHMYALYWTAANLAKWAKNAPFVKKVVAKSRIKYLWDRIYQISPEYFYGGAYRFYGGYYSLVPTITGDQDPVKSKEMFDKCIQAAPEYLETKVLCADAYCTHGKIKDRKLFKKLLDEVLKFDIDKYPDILPENKLAQEKARNLLKQEEELFE
ncbi:hypothetical protein JYT51_00925 [Candidatus Amoebophilus asiaticus]|nr:hypothetical protein [Candidatus Amoebophilus asiaticus]